MKLFDFSLLVGADPRSSASGSLEDLVSYLDTEDAGGLVASLAGAYYDFAAGNDETLDLAGSDRRLLPALTVDPRRVDGTDLDYAAAARKGFRALALFPAIQNWQLSHPAIAAIAADASDARLPIVVHVARSEPVASPRRLADSVDVPVVVIGLAYGSLNEVILGGRGAGNLLFGVSLFAGLDNIETLCERLGPERLVFDSGEPLSSHSPGLEVLKCARIDQDAREKIMRLNAERIFGGLP